MTDEADVYTPAQYREHQDGHGERDPDAHPHTGKVRDEDLSRYLSIVAQHYDPTDAKCPDEMPGRADDLAMVEDVVRIATTETAREALENGDMPTLKHLTGDAGQRADVSGLKAIDALTDMVTGPAPMFYLWAEPGTGKTNFALLLAQLWAREQSGETLLASNIRTLRETDEWTDPETGETRDGWLSSFGELEEWIQQDGDPLHNDQRPKLFIFDEASSNAGGGGSDGYQTKQKMGPLAYKIRKYGGALIVVGHDGKDVHPLIRELGVAVEKESKKEATFYEDVKHRDGINEILSVEGIPPTDYRYDDSEPTEWSWSRHHDEDEYEPGEAAKDAAIWTVIRCKEEGMTNRETAQFVPFTHGWVGSRWREYKEGELTEDRLSKVEEVIA